MKHAVWPVLLAAGGAGSGNGNSEASAEFAVAEDLDPRSRGRVDEVWVPRADLEATLKSPLVGGGRSHARIHAALAEEVAGDPRRVEALGEGIAPPEKFPDRR